MNSPDYFLIDTFVSGPFSGNTTPVCLVDASVPDEVLQGLAKTFNAAVSVFVIKNQDDDRFLIRYFTKTNEIPACGHGTLGAAYCLFDLMPESGEIGFQTIEHRVLTAKTESGLTFVEYPKFTPEPTESQPGVLAALGIESSKSQFYSPQLESLFIEVNAPEQVENLSPDFAQLLSSSNLLKEVVVMCVSDRVEFDIILRAFCPWVGIEEDPVTGSVHSVLGPYWEERFGIGHQLRVYQASQRSGQVFVTTGPDSVSIGGRCHLILNGQLQA